MIPEKKALDVFHLLITCRHPPQKAEPTADIALKKSFMLTPPLTSQLG